MFLQREIFAKNDLYTQVRALMTTRSPTYCKQILIFSFDFVVNKKNGERRSYTTTELCIHLARTSVKHTNQPKIYRKTWCFQLQSNLSLLTPLYYGHLFITDCSFVPRNAKNHTFPTSIIRTHL